MGSLKTSKRKSKITQRLMKMVCLVTSKVTQSESQDPMKHLQPTRDLGFLFKYFSAVLFSGPLCSSPHGLLLLLCTKPRTPLPQGFCTCCSLDLGCRRPPCAPPSGSALRVLSRPPRANSQHRTPPHPDRGTHIELLLPFPAIRFMTSILVSSTQ